MRANGRVRSNLKHGESARELSGGQIACLEHKDFQQPIDEPPARPQLPVVRPFLFRSLGCCQCARTLRLDLGLHCQRDVPLRRPAGAVLLGVLEKVVGRGGAELAACSAALALRCRAHRVSVPRVLGRHQPVHREELAPRVVGFALENAQQVVGVAKVLVVEVGPDAGDDDDRRTVRAELEDLDARRSDSGGGRDGGDQVLLEHLALARVLRDQPLESKVQHQPKARLRKSARPVKTTDLT
eukprot:2917098-Rhodomonas_salina.2